MKKIYKEDEYVMVIDKKVKKKLNNVLKKITVAAMSILSYGEQLEKAKQEGEKLLL